MATNATELMRLMVVRSPESKPDQPVILLAPSAEIMRAPAEFQKAREFLAKMLEDPNRRIVDPEQVPHAAKLAALRQRAFDSQSEEMSPAKLVEHIFAKPASAVMAVARWETTLAKLSDNILFYKLAYRSGPRPLTELASLYRAMVTIGRIAGGDIADLPRLRALLGAPLRLPPPFARENGHQDISPMEARRQDATEAVLGRVRHAVELHKEEQSIRSALDELIELPINSTNFMSVTLAGAVGSGSKREMSGAEQAGSPQAAYDQDILAANWALRREMVASGAADMAPLSSQGLALTPTAARGLSAATKKVIDAAGLDLGRDAVEGVASALARKRDALRASREGMIETNSDHEVRTIGGVSVARTRRAGSKTEAVPIQLPANLKIPDDMAVDWDDLLVDSGWPGDPSDPGSFPENDLGPSLMRPAGVGQLYVIRQHITGYRSGEISHIENVLPGETRERTHRRLRQQEVSSTEVYEREQEDEKSLQTTNRSELEREVQSTIKRQFNAGASAQVSGDYGKVEFTASGQVQTASATEAATKTAQRVASEVIETSRQRVTERIRTERAQKTLDELEETNLHKFSGEQLTEPLVGVYQWLDKVYRNEIWTYGTRTMYEVIAPEPGAALIAAAMTPGASDPALVKRPPDLTMPIGMLDATNVHKLCATYGVTEEIEPYPEPVLVNVAFTQSSDKDAHDNFYAETKDVEVPDGYEPVDG